MALFTKITVFAKYSLKLCGFWSIVSLLEIYRVKLARAMYSSAFSNSAFLTLSGGGLIHGTDFTSDFTLRRLPSKHRCARICLDAWPLLRAGCLFDVRTNLYLFDAQRGLFHCVDRLSASYLFSFFSICSCVFYAHSKNAFAVELWESVSFFLCFLRHP